MIKIKTVLKIAFSLMLFVPAGAHALDIGNSLGLSPFESWQQKESDHFVLTYPEELEPTAAKTITHLEDAHHRIAPILQWEPRHKVSVILLGNNDAANGMTSAIGRFGIVLYAVPPENYFSTYYYEDWLRLLCIHEYAHFLNMDATSGPIWDTLRVVFGDVFLPNAIWPLWMLEGLAVTLETKLTQAGRGRSPYYNMLLRTAVLEGSLEDRPGLPLYKMSGVNPYFPGGESAYIFGSSLIEQLTKSQNPDVLGDLSYGSSGRIPFFLNGHLENISGKTWSTLWDEWAAETQSRIEKDLKTLRTLQPTEYKVLTDSQTSAFGASVSPDGRFLAWTEDSPHRRIGLLLRDLRSGETHRLSDKFLGVGLSFTPDSKRLVFSRLEQFHQYKQWSDLFVVDVESHQETRLTHGLRAKDPDVSPDGHKIVFVQVEQNHLKIVQSTLESEQISNQQTLYTAPDGNALATPRWSPDGQTVVFSEHPQGLAQENLVQVSAETRARTVLLADGAFNRHPRLNKSGDITFVSDKNGVDNIYLIQKGGSQASRPLTHLLTGAWFPVWSPEGELFASVMTVQGWELAQVSTLKDPVRALPSIHAPEPVPVKQTPKDALTTSQSSAESHRAYSAGPSLFPRQWAPLLSGSSQGWILGAEVLGFDTLDLHEYFGAAAYDTAEKQWDGAFQYTNRQLGPSVSLGADSRYLGLHKLQQIRETRLQFSLSFPWMKTWSSLDSTINVNWSHLPLFKDEWSVDGIWVYSNAQSSRLAVGPERGRTLQLSERVYASRLTPAFKTDVSWTEYVALGHSHWVLIPRVEYAVSTQSQGPTDPAQVWASGPDKSLFQFLSGRSLSGLRVRGYPGQIYAGLSAAQTALDLRFPLERVFAGIDTLPLFFRQWSGLVFAENSWVEGGPLPSVGAGIIGTADVFVRVPIILRIELHKGLNESQGGSPEFLVQLGVNGSLF